MSIKSAILFNMGFVGDGSSTTINTILAIAPMTFEMPHQDSVASGLFNLATLKPSDVISVTAASLTVSSASITTLGTILSVTFSTAPADGSVYTLRGTFVF